MKKIVEYERELEDWTSKQQELNNEIRRGKASNSLIQACITGLYNDKLYMQEI